MRIVVDHRVEDDELDEFGVVNFTVYVRWFGYVVREFLEGAASEIFAGDEYSARVGRIHGAYSVSARRGDDLEIVCHQVKDLGRAVRLGLVIRRDGTKLMSGAVDVVFVDASSLALTGVPESVRQQLRDQNTNDPDIRVRRQGANFESPFGKN